jgi:hypothetical protein
MDISVQDQIRLKFKDGAVCSHYKDKWEALEISSQ